MKAIVVSILKCNDCNINSDLKLKVKKYKKCDVISENFMKEHVEFFTKNDNYFLKNFIAEINQYENIDIDQNNISEINHLLNSYVIIDGALECEQCKRNYLIENEIVDFIN